MVLEQDGVTGYSTNSSDTHKTQNNVSSTNTSVTINISGGTIDADVYGGGYGYTEYLYANSAVSDGGTLYGNSTINITGGTIYGSVYGAGKGYYANGYPTTLGQMYGNSYINVSGSPTISGGIYGAGEGVSGQTETALLEGTTNITLKANLSANIYGGGNISLVTGNTYIYVQSGELDNSTIYGGGNQGKITGNSYIYVTGASTGTIFGGGNEAGITNTYIYVTEGTVGTIYGGSNSSGDVTSSNIEIGETGSTKEINITNIFGANNAGGTTSSPNVNIYSGTIEEAYGGGNAVSAPTTNINLYGGTITNAFGGGKSAGIDEDTNILLDGATVEALYGGSNQSGDIPTTNVTITSGTATYVYGGNNAGGTVTTTNVYINGGTITESYGGNNAGGAVTTTNVNINGGTITESYGGNNAGGTVTTSNITTTSGTIGDVYGGNNADGTTTTSNVIINGGTITNVYGGNNAGGTTTNSNVTINTGNLTSVFGGGNHAETGTTNVLINNGTITNVYGGGDQAAVDTPYVVMQAGTVTNIYGGGNAAGINNNTYLDINGGTILSNVYGGGNEGEVKGNTYVYITDVAISGSAYAGGNGTAAIVYGNTNICVDGLTTVGSDSSEAPKYGCVFGGGNAAATGSSDSDSSVAKVNIVGGSIYGNVYGGANTSVVYGSTILNIGCNVADVDKASDDDEINLDVQNIYIKGTIFGGGEANASGSETYDFDFISVTKGIEIYIDATGHDEFSTTGSIFGSGNASSSKGDSYIYITNYGTIDDPQDNISIQRATLVTIDNSAISLSGITDRTNEYSDTNFTLSRIDELKLINSSTLYLDCGANLLQKLSSVALVNGVEEKATVTIDEETGETVKNVDNRIYMYQGKVLNIATNQSVTAYGEVSGMTFLGMYTSSVNPSGSTGLYNHTYSNGDEITNAGTFSRNSYVLGLHYYSDSGESTHDITVDGFWTNEDNEDNEGYIKAAYVGVTPEEDTYYMWIVGNADNVTVFEITLTASKYATLGTYELTLTGFSTANLKMSVLQMSLGLAEGISLVDYSEIENIAEEEETANSVFGVNMQTGNTGWQTNSSTNFLSADGGTYTGSKEYNSDNSTYTPSLLFCLYHSQNLTEEKALGEMTVRLQVLTPLNDLEYEVSYIDIIITMNTALYQDDYYEAAITPGEKFSLFTTTETNITTTSTLSTYFSLYIPEFSETKYYKESEYKYETSNRVLVSTNYSTGAAVVYPEGTKIVMLDLVSNSYYYYIVTQSDESSGKYIYNLSDFIPMGSTGGTYDEDTAVSTYYLKDQDIVYEEFIFQVNFENSGIESDMTDNTLLMELRNKDNQTLLGVLGIERDTMVYGLYANKDATIAVSAETSEDSIYLGDSFNLNVTTVLTQSVVNSKVVYDTEFFNQQMGVKITIYDNNGNQLTADSLLGIEFILDDVAYYARVDGTVRINTAEKVTNVLSKIKIDTSKNTTLATGTYTIQIDSFGSSDGIYYGLEPSDTCTTTITIINSSYGLEVTTEDECKIVDKETGNTQNGDNNISASISYSSGLSNPIIRVSLYRRDYSSIYAQNYNLVDLASYVTNSLTASSTTYEYIFTESPEESMTDSLTLGTDLVSGTYKLVYSLYDGETYIGDAYEYIIIK